MSVLERATGGSFSFDRLSSRIRNPFDREITKTKGPDFAGGFLMTEVLDNGKDGRTIRLIGNQMPQVPFEGLGGDHRIVKEYYPGNDEAATQVMGAEEPDFSIQGKLTDKRLQDPALYGASTKLAEAIDDFRYRGVLLRLQLGEWVRYANIKQCRFGMKNLAELDYTITFSVIGFFMPTNRNFLGQTKESPFAINEELLAELEAQQEEASTKPVEISQSIFDVFSQNFSTFVAEPLFEITNFVDSILQAKQDIQNSIDRALGLIRVGRNNLARFHRAMGENPYSRPSLSVADETSGAAYLAERRSAVYDLGSILANYQNLLEQLRISIPLRRHLVRDGDTLQKLAVIYYGNVSLYSNIYEHNNLQTTDIQPGDVLEIPRV